MGILEDFRKSKEAQNPNTVIAGKGMLLAEIFKDKRKFYLFGKFLESQGDEEMASRILRGGFESTDIDLLEEKRVLFAEKINTAEQAVAFITKDNVLDIAGRSPDFLKIVNLVGPEKAAVVIQEKLMELVFIDEERFKEIYQLISEREDLRNKKFRVLNAKIDRILKEKNISSKEYLEVLAIPDPLDRADAMRELASRGRGMLQRFMGNTRLGKRFFDDNSISLEETEVRLNNAISELEDYNQAIGEALYLSIQEDPESQQSIFRGILGDKNETGEEKVSFQESRKAELDEVKMKKDWAAFKMRFDYDSKDPEEQYDLKDMFLDDQKRRYEEKNSKGGFWSRIMTSLIAGLIEEKREQLA